MFVQTIYSEPQNILLPNLVCLCNIISQNFMQKNWFTVFNVKVTTRAYIIKIWLFLNCWSVCNQTWFDSTASWAWVSCGKIGLLLQGKGHNKGSKCQWMFVRMIFSESQNILLLNLVWQCSIMSQRHAEFLLLLLLSSRSRSQPRFKMSVNVCLDDIFWITEHFVTKFGMVMQHYEPESRGKMWLLLLLS